MKIYYKLLILKNIVIILINYFYGGFVIKLHLLKANRVSSIKLQKIKLYKIRTYITFKA